MAILPDIVSEKMTLSKEGYKLPISILNMTARKKLADMLNPERELDDTLELIPDYTGLAELLNFRYEEIRKFENSDNPTRALLEEWEKHQDKNPCIGQLWAHLEKLQRHDVMEDSLKYINSDIETELRRHEKPLPCCSKLAEKNVLIDDQLVLTHEDIIHKKPQYYDVFVCWNSESDTDAAFVNMMAKKLEEKKCRLCIPSRDDLPGQAMFHAYATLIKIRCRLMIIVLSDEYLKSESCDFMTKFAHSLSPATKQKRLVPVLVSKMEIPNLLRHVTLCDFTKEDMTDWNWCRLIKAVKDVSPYWDETDDKKASGSNNSVNAPKKEKKARHFLTRLFGRKSKNNSQVTENVQNPL